MNHPRTRVVVTGSGPVGTVRGSVGRGGRRVEPDPRNAAVRRRRETSMPSTNSWRATAFPVWRYLTHLVADRALAEDLTQETFLRMYRHLDDFAGRSRFSAWVFRIALATSASCRRHRAPQRRVLLDKELGQLRGRGGGGSGDVCRRRARAFALADHLPGGARRGRDGGRGPAPARALAGGGAWRSGWQMGGDRQGPDGVGRGNSGGGPCPAPQRLESHPRGAGLLGLRQRRPVGVLPGLR